MHAMRKNSARIRLHEIIATAKGEATKRHTALEQASLLCASVLLVVFGVFSFLYAQTSITAGYRDFNFGSTVFDTPTAEKPESKLWWNDGYWWGSLWDPVANKYRIHRFEVATQSWISVGPDIDDRPKSLGDALWDGQKLYVASHIYAGGSQQSDNTTPAKSGRLYRYSYDPATDTYSLDAGFPVLVNSAESETLVLDKDSTGQLWVTWTQAKKVYVNRSLGDDLTWGTPFVLPVQGSNLDGDDISTIIAFDGNKIGVMWSNQIDLKVYFAVHFDSNADTDWEPREVALVDENGGPVADDHLNVKMMSGSGGDLYAVTKTSLSGSSAPKIYLLKRNSSGTWTKYLVARSSDNYTRAIVILDEENHDLYVFANSGDKIRQKKVSLNDISFPSGAGEVFIEDSGNGNINDPTAAKHNVNSATGLLVLASSGNTHYYFHNYIALPGSAPPTITSFSPASGPAGTIVTISGNNFNGVTSVAFNGSLAASFTVNSATEILATVPDGATTGKISVANSAGAVSSADDFVITTGGSSNSLTFHPTDDAYVKSSSATSNYGSATGLRVEMNSASDVSTIYLKFDVSGMGEPVQSAKLRLRCTDASTQGGSIFSVSNNYQGTSSLWIETGLVWNNAPIITGSALSSLASVSSGQTVELDVTPAIIGNGIYSFALKSNSANAAIYSSKEGTNPPELIIQAPSASPSDTPTIASFTPASGTVATEVTITGSKFDGTTAVTFDGTPAGFTVDSDTQIRAVVPTGATNGRISVTNSAGTSVSANDFILQYYLSLNMLGLGNVTFNPPGGTYDAGTAVTLTATPATGFQFSGWSGDLSGSTNPATITMDGNKDVTATFAAIPSSGPIVHEESQTGGSSASTVVTTSASLIGVSGNLYLAAISSRPHRLVQTVTGLGLTWTLVKSICSGQSTTGMEVWMAQGTPSSNGAVTATFASAPKTAVIAVSRYARVAATNPVGNVIGGNTNGLDGACSGGVNSDSYSFNLATTADGAVVYGAVAIKAKTHTPGAGYTERVEFQLPDAVYPIGVAVEDTSVASVSTLTVNGSMSDALDWAVVALEIKPAEAPSSGSIVYEESQTGGSSASAVVTTSAILTGVSGNLYLAAISSRPKKVVQTVTGLGLTWTLAKAMCSGQSTTSMEVWMAQGIPQGGSNGAVTATFASAPKTAVIVVSRYSGVAATNAVGNVIGGNTNGLDGACSGGVNGDSYSFNLATTVDDAVVYGAVAIKARTHTPGAGYTERVEFQYPHAVYPIGVAVEDTSVASASTVTVNGSMSGALDWAVVALEIKPQVAMSKRDANSENATPLLPSAYQLEQNYPNPFNPSTAIKFTIPEAGKVRVNIYNETGQLVGTLVEGEMAAGWHQVLWNGRDRSGHFVASGVYLYQIVVRGRNGEAAFIDTKRMMLLK